jgi:exodeoxyribonuclease V alpha subunit
MENYGIITIMEQRFINDNGGLVTITGTVEAVIYENPVNGYAVLELDTGDDIIAVAGVIGALDEGETVSLSGSFKKHPKYGEQFAAVSCEKQLPSDITAIRKYLASGVFKGIGKTLAKRLTEAFGADIFTVIETTPERLSEIEGITKKKAADIAETYASVYGLNMLSVFLGTFGISPAAAVNVWKKLGRYAADAVKANPYILMSEGIGLPFATCEIVAKKVGISPSGSDRIRAGVTHCLKQNAQNGHTCLPEDRLLETAAALLSVDEAPIAEEISLSGSEFTRFAKKGRGYLALAEYARAESYIAARLAVAAKSRTEFDYAKLIEIEEETKGKRYNDMQKKAIGLALTSGALVLTGGPGTGKTTALDAVISLYKQRGAKVMVAAPTGKAAKRLTELTGYEAKTVHRLLEVKYDSGGALSFIHDEQNKLDCDILVIDEMSMTDVLLFESLLRGVRIDCRLILVGDKDQLPSVGAGNVLGDIIASGEVPVVSLTEIFRQAQSSQIVTNAHKIVNGEYPDLSGGSDFFFLQRLEAQSAAETVVSLVSKRLPDAYGFSPTDDIEVLCPSRKGPVGTGALNKMLQECLNPPKSGGEDGIKSFGVHFRAGDKVMQIKNNYDLLWTQEKDRGMGIYNGDIGVIKRIYKTEGRAEIDFDGKLTDYPTDNFAQLEHAYACTVHKSQGSEFPAVIIPLLGGYDKLFYRNLLYTAVTRAKKLLIIVGSKNIVMKMVDNNHRALRFTSLRERLTAGFEEIGEVSP